MYLNRTKKIIVAIALVVVLGGGVWFVSTPSRVAAIPVEDLPLFMREIIKWVKNISWTSIKKAASVALQNAATNYLNRMAYETANYITNGGPGQSSLQRRESFGEILRRSGEASVGDFVQFFSEETDLTKMGLNICNPSAQLKLELSLGLLDQTKAPGPASCDIRQIQDNWKNWAQGNVITGTLNINGGRPLVGGTTNNGVCVPPSTAGSCTPARGTCGSGSSQQQVDLISSPKACVVDQQPSSCAANEICIPDADNSCTKDSECPSNKCEGANLTQGPGQACNFDSDCSGGWTCSVSTTSGGAPWIDLTRGKSPSEKQKFFLDMFSPEQSDQGAYIKTLEQFKKDQADKQAAVGLTAQICKDKYDSPTKITNKYIKATCGELQSLEDKTKVSTADDVSKATSGDSETSVWLNAAKIFGRTLISNLLKKYIQGGSFSTGLIPKSTDLQKARETIVQKLRGGGISAIDILSGQSLANVKAELNKPSLQVSNDFDYLNTFIVCPDDRNNVELDNCTMDESFASAARDQKTVGEAMAEGLLDANKPFITNLNPALNGDPFCVRNGYCHSNIVRLRKYRVLPLGWEIAASLSPIDKPVTLGDVVNCFENNAKCTLFGGDPAANIYYHLVDPNWVLKAPETQCKALGYGPKLIDIDVSERQQYCADNISCLAEDDDGKCIGGYGYCTKERSIWRFAGEKCPQQFASCMAFTNTSDDSLSYYLSNSIQTCSSADAGCRWYSLRQDNVGSESNPVYEWNPRSRIYLNKQVKQCDATQAGCSEFISLATPRVNLIPNGNFDYYTANAATNYADPAWLDDALPDTFASWQGPATSMITSSNANTGKTGLRLAVNTGAPNYQPGRISTNITAGIVADKKFVLSWYGKTDVAAGCTTDVAVSTLSTPAAYSEVTYSKDWKRYEVLVQYGANNEDTQVTVSFNDECAGAASPYNVYIDAIKFEINDRASGYTEYGKSGFTYLKSQYQCTKDDVGCDRYKPVSGGFSVPGRINSNDRCPAECVGYQNYLELASNYDILENLPNAAPDPRSVNFIGSTAKSCQPTDVGCEEFTNLNEVAQGGEGKNYFSYLRQCVEDSLGITYYTLEGSDTAGYQVHTWRLLPTNLAANGNPCTNVDVSGKNCVDTAANTVSTTCTAADLNVNLDCRQFYDLQAVPHYVYQSRVIAASTECTPYRRSSTGVTFFGLASESKTCSASANNCREYRGNQSANTRTLFTDGFEQGIDPWDTNRASVSSEAVANGGHSMINKNAVGTVMSRLARLRDVGVLEGREYYVDFWAKNESTASTTFEFANGSEQRYKEFGSVVLNGSGVWQLYHAGPLYMDSSSSTVHLSVRIDPSPTGGPTPVVYLDNVVLREAYSRLFLIKDSWKTPQSCDTPIPGAMLGCKTYENSKKEQFNLHSFSRLCTEEVIGCQAFIDTKNSTEPFQHIYNQDDPAEVIVPQDSISYLVYSEKNRCFEANKGCAALGEPELNMSLPENDPKYITGYKIKTLINNPDQYGTILCTQSGLFCEEYTNSKGSNVYFKKPFNRTCVYKENQNISGGLYSGWFQTDSLLGNGVPKGCSDNSDGTIAPEDFRLVANVDAAYSGWVGNCAADNNLCTEFKDPTATEGQNVLVNAEFSTWPPANNCNPATEWCPSIGNGNTLVYNPPTPGGYFEINPSLRYAITRVNPQGYTRVIQQPTISDPTNAYVISTEVNVRAMPTTPTPRVGIEAQCNWDSSIEQDYCDTGTGRHNFARTCSAGCAPQQCITYDAYYCDLKGVCSNNAAIRCADSTNCGGNPCILPNPAVKTNIPCIDNAECNSYFAPSTDYFCNTTDTDNTSIADRDQTITYTSLVDPKLTNQWQTASSFADLGQDSNGKKLLSCTVSLNHSGGVSEVWWRSPAFQPSKSYFYLDNDDIDVQSCAGQVSRKNGCMLFMNMSDRSTRQFNAFQTYQKSNYNNGSSVSPIVCDPTNTTTPCLNDSNRIIKVKRDRECSEWLACKSATEVYDVTTNSYRQICDQIGTCVSYNPGSNALNCAEWKKPSSEKLDYSVYVNRTVDFDSTDYSGYSMYNLYEPGTFDVVDVSNDGSGPDIRKPDYRLTRVIDTCDSDLNYGKSCGPFDPVTGLQNGVCFSPNKCVVGIDGSPFAYDSEYAVPVMTRAYAEKDSPFPYSVVESDSGGIRGTKFGFQKANICDSTKSSCERKYYKFVYGVTDSGITRYYSGTLNFNEVAIPNCLCQGGKFDNMSCGSEDLNGDGTVDVSDQCPGQGQPVYMRKMEGFINWPGFCMQEDNRAIINATPTEHACLLWYPIENAPSGYDFYNQNRDAGYNYKVPAYYCLETGFKEQRFEWYYDCVRTEGGWLNSGLLDPLGIFGGPSSLPSAKNDYHVEQRDECGGSSWFGHKYRIWIVPNGGNKSIHDFNGILPSPYKEVPLAGPCSYLALAVDYTGNNAAMTNRFWSGSYGGAGYFIGKEPFGGTPADLARPVLGYKLGQDETPFGSAVPSGFGLVTSQLMLRPITEVPRLGSPYACNGDASTCARFNTDSGDPLAVKGWKKDPPWKGNYCDNNQGKFCVTNVDCPGGSCVVDNYVVGTKRLKEIYRKIYGIYVWQTKNDCAYNVCTRVNDTEEQQSVDVWDSGGYFAAQSCSPNNVNSCNSQGGVATACASVPGNTCVNSVFNSGFASNLLYQRCGHCPVYFETEPTPDKRCQSIQSFSSQAACDAAIIDTATGRTCAAIGGYTCAQENGGTQYRCFSDAVFIGNDCKMPYNKSTGDLIPDYLKCQDIGGGSSYCFYSTSTDALGENTGVPCSRNSDCTGNPTAEGVDNGVGVLRAMNDVSYCADGYTEGNHDYGSGQFCVGEPFSRGDKTNPIYIFTGVPVNCADTSAPYVNGLGVTLTGAAKCTDRGICAPAWQSWNKDGDLYCKKYPTGYQPMCDPSVQSCASTGSRVVETIKNGALPLDETLKANPSRSPYIIPAVCNADGSSCKQSIATANYYVPYYPGEPLNDGRNDNGFSVNGKVTGDVIGKKTTLAALKFYMAADKDHMPIRYTEIDWGDGSRQIRTGYYKNYLQSCSPTAYGPLTPIDTNLAQRSSTQLEYAGTPQACTTGIMNYLHTYGWDVNHLCGTCQATLQPCGWDKDCAPGVQCNHTEVYSCYIPKVMVQDNWGWCTNAVYGEMGIGCRDTRVVSKCETPNTRYCKKDSDCDPTTPGNPATRRCNDVEAPSPISSNDAYVKFRGVIKVYKD